MDIPSNTASSEPFLTRVDRLIDWGPLASLLHAIRARVRADVPLPALKMLLLARWYGVNEDSMAEAFQDRISFRRFLGLPLDDFSKDIRLAAAFRCVVAEAPLETQALMQEIETQLLSHGITVTAGRWADEGIVPMLHDAMPPDTGVCETAVFQQIEMAKVARRGASIVARSGEQVEGNPLVITDSSALQPPPVRELPLVRSIIEWPWGATTELKERLNIGREFGFCPYARKLQLYRHVSRKHAELTPCSEGIWVRDLASRNGTFVNDEEVPKGQALLVESDSRLRCGSNCVILLNLKH